ncbi:Thiol-disulfide isomerase or thioredoxin [Natrinema salifodinae]|uniref:Thiol-disulfide isomerase or thioredoxin n=2 Tax=Natrinema salifodinae TaxID=1202768 RepID=A0A1I0NDP6_9EURY|nr:Thiol-disulfide isomerase or thioredoxin [Natrinema salifodinae]
MAAANERAPSAERIAATVHRALSLSTHARHSDASRPAFRDREPDPNSNRNPNSLDGRPRAIENCDCFESDPEPVPGRADRNRNGDGDAAGTGERPMKRRELVAGLGSIGVLAGGTGVALRGLPSFADESSATSDDDSDGPIEVETVDAPGSQAGAMTVPTDDVTVVTFFVTGCGNCQAQIPRLAEARTELAAEYGDRVSFLSVTYQSPDRLPAAELREWWREHGGEWSVGYDGDTSLASAYGAVGYPATLVLDADGEKQWDVTRLVPAADIVDAAESVLEASADESTDSNADSSPDDENETNESTTA